MDIQDPFPPRGFLNRKPAMLATVLCLCLAAGGTDTQHHPSQHTPAGRAEMAHDNAPTETRSAGVDSAHANSTAVSDDSPAAESSTHSVTTPQAKPARAPTPHAVARPHLDSGTLAGAIPGRRFVWSAKNGPLRLLADVVVGRGQSLEIGPGTEIQVAARDKAPAGKGDWADSQFVSLIVRGGSLRILGTASRPVRFVPLRRGATPHWGGIHVLDVGEPSQVVVEWADIPRAIVGLEFERASAKVRHVVVRSTSMGFRAVGGSAPEISNSIIFDARIAGLHSERSGPIVRGSIFVDNSGPAVRFVGTGLARLENNAFWNNAGGDILRGPAGVGGWKSDSLVVPDAFGNVRTIPVFRATALHARLLGRLKDSLRDAPLWKRRPPKDPPGNGPWALSPFSPLLDRGSRSPLCRDVDASPCDIGLWGGKY